MPANNIKFYVSDKKKITMVNGKITEIIKDLLKKVGLPQNLIDFVNVVYAKTYHGFEFKLFLTGHGKNATEICVERGELSSICTLKVDKLKDELYTFYPADVSDYDLDNYIICNGILAFKSLLVNCYIINPEDFNKYCMMLSEEAMKSSTKVMKYLKCKE